MSSTDDNTLHKLQERVKELTALHKTARLGSFSDDFGIRTGYANPKDITLTSITISPTFTLGERMGCLLELRMDSANEEIWTDSDGNATDSRTTAAFEVTYSF